MPITPIRPDRLKDIFRIADRNKDGRLTSREISSAGLDKKDRAFLKKCYYAQKDILIPVFDPVEDMALWELLAAGWHYTKDRGLFVEMIGLKPSLLLRYSDTDRDTFIECLKKNHLCAKYIPLALAADRSLMEQVRPDISRLDRADTLEAVSNNALILPYCNSGHLSDTGAFSEAAKDFADRTLIDRTKEEVGWLLGEGRFMPVLFSVFNETSLGILHNYNMNWKSLESLRDLISSDLSYFKNSGISVGEPALVNKFRVKSIIGENPICHMLFAPDDSRDTFYYNVRKYALDDPETASNIAEAFLPEKKQELLSLLDDICNEYFNKDYIEHLDGYIEDLPRTRKDFVRISPVIMYYYLRSAHECLDIYPRTFPSTIGLKELTLIRPSYYTQNENGRILGLANYGRFSLLAPHDIRNTVHHELFHVADYSDDPLKDDASWPAGYLPDDVSDNNKKQTPTEDQAEIAASLFGSSRASLYSLLLRKSVTFRNKIIRLTSCEVILDSEKKEACFTSVLKEGTLQGLFGSGYDYYYKWSNGEMDERYWNSILDSNSCPK